MKEEGKKPHGLVCLFVFSFGVGREMNEKETCEKSGIETKGTLMSFSKHFSLQSL